MLFLKRKEEKLERTTRSNWKDGDDELEHLGYMALHPYQSSEAALESYTNLTSCSYEPLIYQSCEGATDATIRLFPVLWGRGARRNVVRLEF